MSAAVARTVIKSVLRRIERSSSSASMARVTYVPPSVFGTPALRTEDPRFLRGEGRYLENVEIPGALRAVFVRSIFPHAAVRNVEGLEEARGMPGVVAVYTAADLGISAATTGWERGGSRRRAGAAVPPRGAGA